MAKRVPKETARFELRCSPEELTAWRTAAKGQGISLSSYIRLCLAGANIKVRQNDTKVKVFSQTTTAPQNDPALLRQIVAIGNNLNQLVRWANTHKALAEVKPVEEEVRLIRGALESLQGIGGTSC